jgi:excisionase family DNA binding protein
MTNTAQQRKDKTMATRPDQTALAKGGEPMAKLAYSVTEAGEMIGVCRRTVYELLTNGELRSVKIGRRRLVRHNDLVAFLAALEEAA